MTRRTAVSAAGLLAAAAVVAMTAAACTAGAGTGPDRDRLRVVAAFYPLWFVAERTGGDRVSTSTLAAPGVEAHDLELTPSQVADIAEADLVIYLGGFQPAVDDAVAAHAGDALDVAGLVPLIDASGRPGGEHDGGGSGEEDGADDPHVWLDPERLATIADGVAGRLAGLDPDHAGDYPGRAGALRQELAALDAEYAAGLAGCQRREIVVSHAAFGYLADRYDLTQVAVSGLSPEGEPTPRRLAAVVDTAERYGATTIFFETLVSPRVAEVIAGQVGARTAVLDPIEGLAPGSDQDYLSLMRANLTALRDALDCP
jgi:zinc transport system substrate-binding protein